MPEPSFREAVKADASQKRGPTCGIKLLLRQVPFAPDLVEVLADPSFPSSSIARELEARGYRISANTVARHRNRECRCEP